MFKKKKKTNPFYVLHSWISEAANGWFRSVREKIAIGKTSPIISANIFASWKRKRKRKLTLHVRDTYLQKGRHNIFGFPKWNHCWNDFLFCIVYLNKCTIDLLFHRNVKVLLMAIRMVDHLAIAHWIIHLWALPCSGQLVEQNISPCFPTMFLW